MADIAKKTKRYSSDLTDEEGKRVAPFLPQPAKKVRKLEVDLREVLNVIRHTAVYRWFLRFVVMFLFRDIHDVALMTDRE